MSSDDLFEGENPYVTLTSADGFSFVLPRAAAMGSETINNMLAGHGQFSESISSHVTLHTLSAPVLELVCEYLMYKLAYDDATGDVPDFDIDPEYALELLLASDFLNGK
ncbi:MAG: BTB/POZ protein [Piptocephalis tieghemiana]|nr:MAG: BTB/POZ protein [Piptocephalis tieghemiana]